MFLHCQNASRQTVTNLKPNITIWSSCQHQVPAVTMKKKKSSSGQVLLEIISSLQCLASLPATCGSVPPTHVLFSLLPLSKPLGLAAKTGQILLVLGSYCAHCMAHLHTRRQTRKRTMHYSKSPNVRTQDTIVYVYVGDGTFMV